MNIFELSYDWVDLGNGLDDPCLESTFAQVSIRVGSAAVTRVLDRRAQTTRDFVLVPLYPLTEWIVANWWTLFEEAEVPSRGISSADYRSRHDFRTAREGYSLPALQVCPQGEWVLLKWEPAGKAHSSVEFLEIGQDRVPTDGLRQRLADLVDAVLDRLGSRKIEAAWLRAEWDAIREITSNELEFCRVAGSLGYDPYDLPESMSEELVRLNARLPAYLQQEVFKAAPPSDVAAAVGWVEAGLQELPPMNAPVPKWVAALNGFTIQRNLVPWEAGYELARQLRHSINVSEKKPLTVEDVSGRAVQFAVAARPPRPSMDGLVSADQSGLRCYTAKARADSRQFLVARGLGTLLWERTGRTEFCSSAQTDNQQRSRAFAAELLAPAALLRERLSGDEVSNEEVEDLAASLSVSEFVVNHQIRNHRLGTLVA